MTDLTIPNPPQGMLRRGSPVVATYYGDPGVYVFLDPESAGSGLVHLYHLGRIVAHPEDCSVALDLTDATGRAHAAWWVARFMAVDVDQPDPYGVLFGMTEKATRTEGVWSVWGRHHGARFVPWLDGMGQCGTSAGTVVPALANLDPNDPRTLPDGSRWVDAEALRLVCLHLMEATDADAG